MRNQMKDMSGERKLSRRATLRGAVALLLAPFATRISLDSAHATGTKIVRLSKLPIGSTFSFTTSTQGLPAIVFRTKTGVFAYSMICTHQGGSLTYSRTTKKLACPLHGAQFDPLKEGKASKLPAGSSSVGNLPKVKVAIKGGWVVEA
ncbi:MAG: Rieske 2Fe-2S domain-containing protein [Actinobacteria bacterium]|nr:Rieske 2Fe-2S domain-containing protein [Actinomycetota bacterium]